MTLERAIRRVFINFYITVVVDWDLNVKKEWTIQVSFLSLYFYRGNVRLLVTL